VTETQRALIKSELRRHIALSQACIEPAMKEMHLAVAEALEAAIFENEVEECKSETKCISCRMVLVRSRPQKRYRANRTRRRGR